MTPSFESKFDLADYKEVLHNGVHLTFNTWVGSLHWVAMHPLISPSPTYFLWSVAPVHLCRQTTGGQLYGLADYMQLVKGSGTLPPQTSMLIPRHSLLLHL